MSTPSQIKQIHTLKNIIGLEDDLYRDMLASFGVCSSKDLTDTEAQILIEILNDKVDATKRNSCKKYDDFNGRDKDMATPPQLRKIEAIWKDICSPNTQKDHEKTLRKFIEKHFHIADIRFITKSKASRIIAILEKIKLQKCLKAL